MKCGFTNLHDLCEGDCLGSRVSHDGVLTFFVNGKAQGVAAQDVTFTKKDTISTL